MNKFITLVLLFVITSKGYSQEVKTTNLSYYIDLIKKSISESQYKTAKLYSDTSMILIDDNAEGVHVAYLMRSLTFSYLQKFDSSNYYLTLVDTDFKNDSTSLEFVIYLRINAILSRHEGNYEESSDFFEREQQILSRYPSRKKQRCAAIVNLATAKMLLSNYITAIEYFNEANQITEELNDTTLQLKALVNMGVCYSYLKEYHKSAKIQEKVLELALQSNNTLMTYYAHANLGTQYHQINEIKKAKYHLQICIDDQNYKFNERICLFTMSYILRDEGKVDSAIIISEKVLKINERQNNVASIIKSKHQLGELYRKKGLFTKSAKLFKEALSLSIEKNDLYSQSYIYDALINLEIDKKQLWNLSNNWIKYRELRDSLYSLDISNGIAEAETKYQTEKQEAENQLLKKEQELQTATIKQQSSTLIGTIIGLALLALLSFFLFRRNQERKRTNRQLSTQKEEIEALHKELSHRVKNNLLFMSSLLRLQGKSLEEGAAKQAVKDGEARLEAMSLLHRRLGLEAGNNNDILIGDYIRELTSYLKTSFAQLDKNLEIEVESEDIYLAPEYAMRLGIIINELITNSIKHAFDQQSSPKITTQLRHENNGGYTLRYHDNGKGLPEGYGAQSDSLGMKLIDTLTRQLKGTMKIGHTGGTSLIFTFNQS